MKTDHQYSEPNRNQTLLQNISKADHHDEIKNLEASGASGDEEQQHRCQKTNGQSDNVDKGMKSKKTNIVKKCKVCSKF